MPSLQLDTPVTIEEPIVSKDSSGAPVTSWYLFAKTFVEWRPVLPSRSEAVRQGLQQARDQVRVRLRYTPGLDPSFRFVKDGTAYPIVGGPAEIGRREVHECVLERYST